MCDKGCLFATFRVNTGSGTETPRPLSSPSLVLAPQIVEAARARQAAEMAMRKQLDDYNRFTCNYSFLESESSSTDS